MSEFAVEYVDITTVKPYTNNPRINDPAVSEVAESIRQYGWRQPIVVDSNNIIIAGHTRYLAAKELGQTLIPVHVAQDLTPEQVKAYRIVDNATNEAAAWDLDKLQVELADLEVSGESWDRLNDYIEDFNSFAESTHTQSTESAVQPNYSNSSPINKSTGNSELTEDSNNLLEMRGSSFYDGADGGRETTAPIKYLTIGKRQIPLTPEEEERILTAIRLYGDEYGTHFGFASRLLEGKYSNV